MENQDLIAQIKETEKKANENIQKSRQETSQKIGRVKTEKESELSGVRQKFAQEIKKIMAEADKEIAALEKKIGQETESELDKIRNIPADKKEKAASLIIDTLIKG